MKKLLLAILTVTGTMAANAQVVDTVKVGTGYGNCVWYSLSNDEQGTKGMGDWDIAFNVKDIESSIRVNTAAGVHVWGYPKGDKTAWATVDTTGISGWDERYNNDVSWSFGAMGDYIDASNINDVDWGIYDPSSHDIFGDSLYIIQLSNGNYKKLIIESLIKGTFTFKYADVNGSNEVTATLAKSTYIGKNFGYYSIQNGAAADLEPLSENWDLFFTRYTAMIDMGGGSMYPYAVSGVLHNRKVEVAEVKNVADVSTFVNFYPEPFAKEINTIGYDWKVFDLQNNTYDVKDSLVYFIKSTPGDIWKLIFTGFYPTGGAYEFSKQKLVSAGINDTKGTMVSQMALAPNPARYQNVTLVYDFDNTQKAATVNVFDMAGRIVHSNVLDKQAGLHQYTIPSQNFSAGVYMVTIDTDNGRITQKLVIQ